MISKIIAQDKIHQVEKLLDSYNRIVIITHTSPDGDAIGSSLGLYHLLNTLDKEVRIVVNTRVPSNLKWLNSAKEIVVCEETKEYAAELIAAAELIFCLDFNTTRRMGEAVEKMVLASTAKRVMVDHHPDPQPFADVTISYPALSSTSELVFRLICRMGYFENIDIACAEAIFTGMMTDTGNFAYNSNSPEVFSIIAELLSKNINKDKIYSRVNGSHSANRMRLLGIALHQKMTLYPEHRAACIALSASELKQYDAQPGDTEGFVNIPLNIEDISLSVFLREENNRIKVSLRSNGEFNVNEMAQKHFNGGGHRNASGGELFCTLEQAIEHFEQVIRQDK